MALIVRHIEGEVDMGIHIIEFLDHAFKRDLSRQIVGNTRSVVGPDQTGGSQHHREDKRSFCQLLFHFVAPFAVGTGLANLAASIGRFTWTSVNFVVERPSTHVAVQR